MSQVIFSNVESLIADFSKAKKVSRASLAEFVQTLQASAVIEGKTSSAAGRKTSQESYKIREFILSHKAELVGKKMTVKEFGAIIGADAAMVTNNLKWLAEHEKCVKIAGVAEKPANQRGRAASLWEVIV